jgi:ribosomal protein S18 acetylase RimI-like enzyme
MKRPSRIRIRRARVTDAAKIRRLEQRVWRESAVTGRYEVAPDIVLGIAFVALAEERMVGVILARGTLSGTAYVTDWVVDRNWRRQGIGMRLYEALIAALGRRPLLTFVDRKDPVSLHLHRRLGFRIVTTIRDPYGIGEASSRLVMARGDTGKNLRIKP